MVLAQKKNQHKTNTTHLTLYIIKMMLALTLFVLLSFLLTQPVSCILTSSSTRFTSTQLHIASPITANYSQILVRSRLACAAQCDRLTECTAFNTTKVTTETPHVTIAAAKWQIICTLFQEKRENLILSVGNNGPFVKSSVISPAGTCIITDFCKLNVLYSY